MALTALVLAIVSGPATSATKRLGPINTLLWGDTHVHTSLSADAYIFGNTEVGPEHAYRFARGEKVRGSLGSQWQLSRPLDFVVLADHSEYLGGGPEFIRTVSRILEKKPEISEFIHYYSSSLYTARPVENLQTHNSNAWKSQCETADAFNEPGLFSTLLGFEWSSMPGGATLHRVVIFREGAESVCQVQPYSAFDSEDPVDLWQYLEDYEQLTGGGALAIPHNANLSGGLMFASDGLTSYPDAFGYIAQRKRWEPVYEIVQIKGNSETHSLLSPDDRFAPADFFSIADQVGYSKLAGSYARPALLHGLQLADQYGSNPFHFGFIGSSDSHSGLAAVAEDNFPGKFGFSEPGEDRSHWNLQWPKEGKPVYEWQTDAAGYAAIWARNNSREEIFDALKRREVYATTGSRIQLRFFGSWNFPNSIETSADAIDMAYQHGVPMGGLLELAVERIEAPQFLVIASQDPMGSRLERVQIVKGSWVPNGSLLREQIYDVAIAPDTAEGSAQLAALWRDPEYQPGVRSFYYARVIELPRQRWSSLDARRLKQKLPLDIPRTVREKAYSSPIWVGTQH